MSDDEHGTAHYASSPCMAHEIAPDYFDVLAVDPEQSRDVARWRRAERTRLLRARRLPCPALRHRREKALSGWLRTFIHDHLCNRPSHILAAYWPIAAEPDLRPLMAELIASGTTVALPVVESHDAPLGFRRWTPATRMAKDEQGVLAPEPHDTNIKPEVLLAPLVGWDPAGYRLGYGTGYLDRTFAALSPRPFAIGVGLAAARLSTISPATSRYSARCDRHRGGHPGASAAAMTSSAEQVRAWTGPALLSFGFRPFFMGAALWAAFSMITWILMLSGYLSLPTAFDPVSWHAHEFLFGYLSAVVAGFLLTSVPNWTGRLPIVGWPLGGLFALWLSGRVAIAVSAWLSPFSAALIDLAMPLALAVVIAREIIAGRNWRNVVVIALLTTLILSNAVFHWEAARGDFAAQGYGLRFGLSAGLMLIALIGGRIVPSFTRNWLVRQGKGRLPAPPMQRLDRLALVALAAALLLWAMQPHTAATGWALLAVGMLHLVRLGRWAGDRTLREPLVWVLHAGYAFLPLGAIALGSAMAVHPGSPIMAAAQHLWMGGAIGLMTLAVMTRATLGHTGQALTAGPGTVAVYGALVLAVAARMGAGVWPEAAGLIHGIAGLLWIAAFTGFVLIYGPLLLRPRRQVL